MWVSFPISFQSNLLVYNRAHCLTQSVHYPVCQRNDEGRLCPSDKVTSQTVEENKLPICLHSLNNACREEKRGENEIKEGSGESKRERER